MRRRGYTLLELLAVITLLGVIVGLVSANISATVNSVKSRVPTNLARTLENLRNDSIVNGRYTSFSINDDLESYTIKKYIKYDEDSYEIHSFKLEDGWRFIGRCDIEFAKTGVVSNTKTIILQNSNGDSYNLTVDVSTSDVNLVQIKKGDD